mgnify:CR=1 FL=1|tara:strand:+ start:1721 stop:2119 length:399 start_codon:yes stop_codon:yes gene_type:complete
MAKEKVYWNVRKKCYSIQRNDRVYEHAPYVALECVDFKVSQAGNKRVRDQQRKNVHAMAVGHRMYHVADEDSARCNTRVIYNPYHHTTFINEETEQPVHSAHIALFTTKYCATTNTHKPIIRAFTHYPDKTS